MAFRVENFVARGRIDCSLKGTVTGEIFFEGKGEPIILNLEGFPHPDLAGCILTFEQKNSKPIPDDLVEALRTDQTGQVGDMSAAQKRKILTVPIEELDEYRKRNEKPPFVWKNIIYLEWFSIRNGRVVIEGVDFDWKIDLPRWTLTEEDVKQQSQANADSLGGFMDQALEAFHDTNEGIRENELKINPNADDEFAWEKRLKESDKRADALADLLGQFEDPEDHFEAFEKALEGRESETDNDYELSDDFGVDDNEISRTLPPEEMSTEVISLWQNLERKTEAVLDFYKDATEEDEERYEEWICELISLGIKSKTIASLVLNSEGYGHSKGHLIAMAKREIARCQKVLDAMVGNSELEALQSSLWELRNSLIEVAGELRKPE